MNNLFKKVLLASAIALATLGSSLVAPAQAQTPTPTPAWKVTISCSGPHDGNGAYGIPVGTPLSYLPSAGLNGLSFSGITSTRTIPATTPYRNDFDVTATFTWQGTGAPPSTINIGEAYGTVASAIPGLDEPPSGGYGSAIDYIALLPNAPSSTTTTTAASKQCDAQFTTFNVPVSSGVATVTHHITSHLIVDWSREPSMTERPERYSTTWHYSAGLAS